MNDCWIGREIGRRQTVIVAANMINLRMSDPASQTSAASLRTSTFACHFGPASEPLSGWFHAAENPGGVAVLICPPIGDEALSVYRGLRDLACDLAAAGMPTLRFDPAGTGDSADPVDLEHADQVAVWLRSVRLASEALRASSGLRSLALVSVRHGCLIAAQAAYALDDVVALVALLPVQDGRAYLRECRLLRASLDQEAPEDGSALAGGHRYNPATVRRLQALGWQAVDNPGAVPPRHALVIDRDDRPSGAACAEHLRRQGTAVTHEPHAGLGRLTMIAHESEWPPEVAARIVGWLAAVARETPSAATMAPDLSGLRTGIERLATPGGEVLEAHVGVGSAPRLAGIVTRPAASSMSGGRRGVVLLSSGSERQIGPHRILACYARERAARGDIVLRVDRAGIGDSESRPGGRDNDPFDAQAVDDVAAALAFLRTQHGVGPCSIIGFCAGAFHGWRATLAGVDVDRLVSINPVAYAASASRLADPRRAAFQVAILKDARRSVVDLQRWRQLLRGELRIRGIGLAVLGRTRARWTNLARRAARVVRRPMVDDLAADLAAAGRRGVRQDFVFSDGEPGWVLLREQGGGVLKRLLRHQQVRVRHLTGADHTFTTPGAQSALRAAMHTALDAESERHRLSKQPAGLGHAAVV